MRFLRPPFASAATLSGALLLPAALHAADETLVPAPFPITLRTILAVAIMIAIGVFVGWLLGRHDQHWRRFW